MLHGLFFFETRFNPNLLFCYPDSRFSNLISLFFITVAFCCYILALGLALGKSSLYILFYHYFPFFNYPRVSDRIIVMVLFSIAIVTGFVVKKIQDHFINQRSLHIVTGIFLLGGGLQLVDYNLLKPMGVKEIARTGTIALPREKKK